MARIGVVGLERGLHVARLCARAGLEVRAICDRAPARLARGRAAFPEAMTATDAPQLLAAGLDGVVLAGDFDAHAPLAVAFLERGVHVLSETAACTSAAEGRALVAAEAASAATYSFAENYVAHPHVTAIADAVAGGEVGEPELVECDYLHGLAPADLDALVGDPAHWRGRIAPTQYCTHTLSPILAVTGAEPVEVAAWPVQPRDRPTAVVLAVRLSSGALALARHGFLQGEVGSHWSWLSVRGTRGIAESLRAPGEDAWSVRVRREPWAGATDELRAPPPPLRLGGEPVDRMDEGTARIALAFRATLEEAAPPLVPVAPAVAASLVGVAAATSLAEGGRPVRCP